MSSIGEGSTSPPQVSDPFTDRLDTISMNNKHQRIELEHFREKLLSVNSRIDAMSAVHLRQKDQEVSELRQQVEMHKTTIADLQEKQDKMNGFLTNLEARIHHLEAAERSEDRGEALEAVERGLHSIKGEMFALEEKMMGEYTRKEDSDQMESRMEELINSFIDDVNKELEAREGREGPSGGLVNRVAELERRKLDERIGRVEALSFELLTSFFHQAKFERGSYEVETERRREEMDGLLNMAPRSSRAGPSGTTLPTPPVPAPITIPPPSALQPPAPVTVPPPSALQTPATTDKSSRKIIPLTRHKEPESSAAPFGRWNGLLSNPADKVPMEEQLEGIKGVLQDAIGTLTATGDVEVPKATVEPNVESGNSFGTASAEADDSTRASRPDDQALPTRSDEKAPDVVASNEAVVEIIDLSDEGKDQSGSLKEPQEDRGEA